MPYFQHVEFALYAVVITPILAYFAGKVTECLEKRSAYKDLVNNPNVKVGARFEKILEAGNPVKLCDSGFVYSLAKGDVGVMLDDTGHFMHFTCREWKALHPVWSSEK